MGYKVSTNQAGYSSSPLAKKLGIKAGFNLLLINQPDYYFGLFTDLPANLIFSERDEAPKDFIHFFTKQEDDYVEKLPALKKLLKPNGMIWISWPKKSSKVITNVTENLVRGYAIKIGLVDIKVCAVDEIWSGLKLVIPVKDR
jgi:hypothetical protein